jgi:hypothetical protein
MEMTREKVKKTTGSSERAKIRPLHYLHSPHQLDKFTQEGKTERKSKKTKEERTDKGG